MSDHFREIPLPCTKIEWEARTEAKWRFERANAAKRRGVGVSYSFGDLIDAHQQCSKGGGASESEREKLDIWNAGIDGLGMLLNLAVHLVC